jgi:hypothetical protein
MAASKTISNTAETLRDIRTEIVRNVRALNEILDFVRTVEARVKRLERAQVNTDRMSPSCGYLASSMGMDGVLQFAREAKIPLIERHLETLEKKIAKASRKPRDP